MTEPPWGHAVPDGVFDEGLDTERKHVKLGLVELVSHVEAIAQTHLLYVRVGHDVIEFLREGDEVVTIHGLDASAQMHREVLEEDGCPTWVIEHDLLD